MRLATVASLSLGLCLLPLTAVAELEQLYFSEDFSTADRTRSFFEGTLEERQFRYVDNEYEIDTSAGNAYGQSVLLEELDTYRVEVTGRMIQAGDNDSGFGLSFNYRERENEESPAGDYLLFLVYDRASYTVLRYLAGNTTILYSPTKTKLFEPGDPVTLTIEANKGTFVLFLNGAEVATLSDEQLTSGGFGLFTTAGSIARFDDFKVYAAPTEPESVEESFDTPGLLFEGQWGDAEYHYEEDRYTIDTTNTRFIGLSPFPEPALSFELEVDVELVAGEPTGGWGVYLRDHPNEQNGFDQFRFLVYKDWYAVEQSKDERPFALVEWVQHSAVHADGVNRLKVRAAAEELVFYVNEIEVYRGNDEHPKSGAFGFFVSGGIKVAFDNVCLTMLP